MIDKVLLGKRIRGARMNKGCTIKKLSEMTDIGIVYISEIERGLKMPSLNTFIKIIEALNVSADYILRDELSSGKVYTISEISDRLKHLTPKQTRGAIDILDAYLRNL